MFLFLLFCFFLEIPYCYFILIFKTTSKICVCDEWCGVYDECLMIREIVASYDEVFGGCSG